MTKIIAFAGKKGSGKNTASNWLHALEMVSLGLVSEAKLNNKGQIIVPADVDGEIKSGVFDINNKITHEFLKENLWQFIKQYSYADPLKEFCINVFGLSYESCYGSDEQKNQHTNLLWENMPGVITEQNCGNKVYLNGDVVKKGIELYYHNSGYMTGRDVLQYFGTNICRKIYGECWTQALIKHITREQTGLAVICDVRFKNEVEAIQKAGGKVVRLTRSITSEDIHPSELELDDYTGFDYILDNKNMSIEQQNQAVYNLLVKDWGWLNYD